MNWRLPLTGQMLLLALLAAPAVPSRAAAQAQARNGALSEIVVTAERRRENLQTVPVAITAITGSSVQRLGIHNLDTLAADVPGLTMSRFSAGQNIISLRGVSNNDDGPGTDASVAVFVDGVYFGRVSNINPGMFDVSRVEVLRGPQGTLYGKNTIGGAINIITTDPQMDGLHARARATVGNYHRHDFFGSINGPIGGHWAANLSVATRKADGWVHNIVLGVPEKDDNNTAAHAKLMRVGDHTRLVISFYGSRIDEEDMARIPMSNETHNLPFSPLLVYQDGFPPLGLPGCGHETNPRCATNPYGGYQRQLSYGTSVTFTDQLTAATQLISISAWNRTYNQWSMDSLGALLPLGNDVSDNAREWTEELRLVSAPTTSLKYVAGLWFSREDVNRLRLFLLPSLNPNPSLDEHYRGINRTLSQAVYGQLDWYFAPRWDLTVGGRYSYDHKSIGNDAFGDSKDASGYGGAIGLGIVPNSLRNQVAAGWSKFTPKVSVTFRPRTNITLYATAAEGYQSGGFAATPTSVADTRPLRPETAQDLEIGAKMEFAQRLRANIALFDTHYKDLQIQAFGPRPGAAHPPGYIGEFDTFNAGGARADGAEVELTWLATDALKFDASYGYLDARFTGVYIPNASVYSLISGPGNAACVAAPTTAGCVDLRNQSGKAMLRAPRNKGSLDAVYTWSLGSRGSLQTSANYSYTGSQRGELEPYAIQPAFGLLGARLSWTDASGAFEVSLWGRNLADKAWVSHVYTIADEVFGVYGEPRTYGLTFSWDRQPR